MISTGTPANHSMDAGSVFSSFVGEAEASVRAAFARARAALPAIIFFDEVEQLVGRRSFGGGGDKGGGGDEGVGVQQRVLATFLNEMDGMESAPGLLVLGATNRPDMIDAALMRPGRFDNLVYVGPPDEEARKLILQIHTVQAGMQLDEDVDLGALARMPVGSAALITAAEDSGAVVAAAGGSGAGSGVGGEAVAEAVAEAAADGSAAPTPAVVMAAVAAVGAEAEVGEVQAAAGGGAAAGAEQGRGAGVGAHIAAGRGRGSAAAPAWMGSGARSGGGSGRGGSWGKGKGQGRGGSGVQRQRQREYDRARAENEKARQVAQRGQQAQAAGGAAAGAGALSGADIEGICREAAVATLRGDIDAQTVPMAQLVHAWTNARPSLSQQTLQWYEEREWAS